MAARGSGRRDGSRRVKSVKNNQQKSGRAASEGASSQRASALGAPEVDLGPPLVDPQLAGQSRQALDQLQTIASTVTPAPQVNPLEDMVREMLKPMMKQWLDEHLPQMVDEHVKREITRITGRPL